MNDKNIQQICGAHDGMVRTFEKLFQTGFETLEKVMTAKLEGIQNSLNDLKATIKDEISDIKKEREIDRKRIDSLESWKYKTIGFAAGIALLILKGAEFVYHVITSMGHHTP